MSHTYSLSRISASLAIVAASALVTACGGGNADSDSAASGSTSTVSSSGGSSTSTTSSTSGSTTTGTGSTSTSTSTTTDTTTTGTSGTTTSVSTEAVLKPVTAPSRTVTTVAKGFYVSGGKLYDPNSKEFRIRGVNRVHWDDTSAGLPLSKANTERIAMDFTQTAATNLGIINSQMLANKIVPMPGNWAGTCSGDPAVLSSIVDTWVAQASTWTQLNTKGLINIANEWGPGNSTVWRDSYITAITRMRAAGYTGALVVDSGGCGQDPVDLINYGAAVLAADPLKNVLFDLHVYGNFVLPASVSWQTDYATSMAAIKATGLAVFLGEFGPGDNIGPSPTSITPQTIIATAEANGWGWAAWAWDDNNLANCQANDDWFAMSTNCGNYTTSADLTTFGKVVVAILQATAVTATNF